MVNGKHTRHYLSTFIDILQRSVVYATGFYRCSLLFGILCTMSWNRYGRLLVNLPAWQATITSKMPRKSGIVTWIITGACKLLSWRSLPWLWREETWYPWLLLWRPGNPTAWLHRVTWSLLNPCQYQPVSLRCTARRSNRCLPLFVGLMN